MMANKYDYEKYKEMLKKMLSPKRFNHSVNVADVAEDLAKHYGLDSGKAKIAGLLHDICKELPTEENEKLVSENDKNRICSPKILHGFAGSEYMRNELGITDEEILNAVKYHTVGRKNMTTFEKVISISDYTSPERKWPDVRKTRELAYENLDLALIKKFSTEIISCIKKGYRVSLDTVDAYNYLILNQKEIKNEFTRKSN